MMSTDVQRRGINPERVREFLVRLDAALQTMDEEREATYDEVVDLLTRGLHDYNHFNIAYCVTIPEHWVLRAGKIVTNPEEQIPVSWFAEWDEKSEHVVADQEFEDQLEVGEVYGHAELVEIGAECGLNKDKVKHRLKTLFTRIERGRYRFEGS